MLIGEWDTSPGLFIYSIGLTLTDQQPDSVFPISSPNEPQRKFSGFEWTRAHSSMRFTTNIPSLMYCVYSQASLRLEYCLIVSIDACVVCGLSYEHGIPVLSGSRPGRVWEP
jgi:hypothetical protein